MSERRRRSTRLGCGRRRRRPARAGLRRRTGRPAAIDRRVPVESTASTHIVVLGMGGIGIAGDVLVAGRRSVPAGPGRRGQEATSARVRRANVARVRHLVLRQHRGDGRGRVARRRRRRPGRRSCAAGGALADAGRRRGAAWSCPAPTSIPCPRAGARRARRPAARRCSRRSGCSPARTLAGRRAVEQLRQRRDACARRGRRRRTRPGSWPGASGARSRSSTAAARSGRSPRMRWKAEVNENAKAPAFWNVLPELCHNEICGWGQHGDVTRQVFTLVELRHDFEHPQVDAARSTLTREIVERGAGAGQEVRAEGEGQLAQLLDLMLPRRLRVAAPGRRRGHRSRVRSTPSPALEGRRPRRVRTT